MSKIVRVGQTKDVNGIDIGRGSRVWDKDGCSNLENSSYVTQKAKATTRYSVMSMIPSI